MSKKNTTIYLQILIFFFVLYCFFVSIELMSGAFKLFGKGFAHQLMTSTANPVIGLMIGILATSLVQSSSATSSIIVGMVASGSLSIGNAIPMVMGANIGTTVTNTLVSIGHVGRKQEFQRALAGATVHDFFNIMAVAVFLPLETFTHLIERLSVLLADSFSNVGGMTLVSPLETIVKPVAHLIHEGLMRIIYTPKWAAALFILVVSLIVLFIALKFMVDLTKKLIIGKVENLLHQYLFHSAGTSLVLGLIITAIIQSSSVTTSLIVPIVGAGILSVADIFPYVLGANIGTTITAILASLVTRNPAALTVAFAHLTFNVAGTLLFYPLRQIPIGVAKQFGRFAAHHRITVIVYVLVCFFGIPLLVIALMKGGI